MAQVPPAIEQLELLPHLWILEDPEARLTLDGVRAGAAISRFRPMSEVGNNLGFSGSAFWLRFELPPISHGEYFLLELAHASIDRLTYFGPDATGRYRAHATGEDTPFDSRQILHRTFVFRINPSATAATTHYLRVQSAGSLQIPLTLWEPKRFIENVDQANFIFGCYFGTMLLLMTTALASYARLRDSLFLYYVFYLFSYLLFQFSINGFSFQYLWPQLPWVSSRLTSASVGLVVFGALLFSAAFLDVWHRHRRIGRLYQAYMLIAVIAVAMSLFGDYVMAVQFSTLVGVALPPVVLVTAILSLRSGYPHARYFLAAWCIFLVGIFVAGLLYLGLVPYSLFSAYAMQIGSILEIALLSYALMDKIEVLRHEKEAAMQRAHDALSQTKEDLERKIAERTVELREKNAQLSEMVTRDNMTGLLNHSNSLELLTVSQHAAERYHRNLAVFMIDIDHFKSINDRFGHPAGDQVILAVADILKRTTRDSDGCGRMGGEEFILIVQEMGQQSCRELAERICLEIRQLRIKEIDQQRVTVSIGVALRDMLDEGADLVSAADEALYSAKQNGRDRVYLARREIQVLAPQQRTTAE